MLTSTTLTRSLHRAVSAACAALVVALTVFGASPAAHSWLHASETTHACAKHGKATAPTAPEHDCAVVMFSHAAEASGGMLAVRAPYGAEQRVGNVTESDLHLAAPRYLLQPERGPPASRLN